MPKRRIAVAAMAAAVALGVVLLRAPRGPAACTAEPAVVVVDSSRHVMSLCEQGTAVHWTGVRLGRNGMGKGREGDGKTPVGTYVLESPRPSAEYGSFALVEYPTAEQRRAGATGGAIGVHGPHRTARFLGTAMNLVDTTDGCIGVSSDDEMEELSRFVTKHPHAAIVIR